MASFFIKEKKRVNEGWNEKSMKVKTKIENTKKKGRSKGKISMKGKEEESNI